MREGTKRKCMEASLLQVHAKSAEQGFVVHTKVAKAAFSCSSGRGFAISACFYLCDLCVKPHERRNEEEVYGGFIASGVRKVRRAGICRSYKGRKGCFLLFEWKRLCVKPHERRNEEEVYGGFFASGSRKGHKAGLYRSRKGRKGSFLLFEWKRLCDLCVFFSLRSLRETA